MHNVWTIIKKELRRVFTDFRMIFSLFVLPPLIIVVIYGLMGIGLKGITEDQQEYIPKVVVSNAPSAYKNLDGFEDYLLLIEADKSLEFTFVNELTEDEIEEYKEKILADELDALIVFPKDFVDHIEDESANLKVDIYQNNNSTYYHRTQNLLMNYLSLYEYSLMQEVYERENLAIFQPNPIKLAPEEKETVMVLGMFLPFLLVIFLMAAAMGVGIESVSGEKERGTIATLLVTPIKRTELAIGKILSVAILGVFSSISSFIGMVISMPIYLSSFAGEDAGSGEPSMDIGSLLGVYNVTDFVMMFLVIVVAVLLFVALVVVVSTFAKTLKESNALFMPIYILTMGIAVFTMFSPEAPTNVTPYLVPIYNIIVGLKAIMFVEITAINFLAVILSNLVYVILLVFIIQRMFKSERIMFKQ